MPYFRRGEIPDLVAADGLSSDVVIGDAGGLTQFGALIETLQPGAISALSHWHAQEDEFLLILEGEAVLHEGADRVTLFPGDSACFPAGRPVGHFLRNDSAIACRILMVGTRAAQDVITYPDHDRVCLRNRAQGQDIWRDSDGRPAERPF